jgi:outer membrane protein assembly factor BamE (lipoprotein component of BamABCDE complex)
MLSIAPNSIRRGCVVLAVSTFLFTVACASGRNFAPSINAEKIRAVKLGMTRGEVEKLLGPPVLEKDVFSLRSLQFTDDRTLAYSYPMLWVNLEKDVVVEVYAKKYVKFGFDDEGVYRFAADSGVSEGPAFAELFVK